MNTIDRIARTIAETAALAGTPHPDTGLHQPVIQGHDQLAAFIADGIRAYLRTGRIESAEGFSYTPVIDTGGAGYLVTGPAGRVRAVTLVPTVETGEGPGTGNVFLYWTEDAHVDPLGDALTHVAYTETNPERL